MRVCSGAGDTSSRFELRKKEQKEWLESRMSGLARRTNIPPKGYSSGILCGWYLAQVITYTCCAIWLPTFLKVRETAL